MIALFPNCGFLSETSRMLEIAQALQERGAEVVMASQGGPYEHLLDESGMPWKRLPPGMDKDEAANFLDRILEMAMPGAEPLRTQEFLREAIPAEVEILRETDADMAVIGFNLTTYLSSRVADVPLATSHGGCFIPPVFERNLAPGPVNSPKAALGWLPTALARWLANFVPPRLTQPAAFLNEMADELGVEGVPGLVAMMCGELTLVTDIPEILGIPKDELEAWRPSSDRYRSGTRLRYVGPLYARLDMPIPPEVEAFLEKPEPIVYVSPTSVTQDFLAGLVSAVQTAGARTLVASTIHDISELADERTCIADVLPNHRVMPEVDLVVIMGGQGSVQSAMTAGTPIIGFPHHGEQELNLALAERQGMALRLPPKAAHTPRLTQAVKQMLSDDGARRNAAQVRSLYEGVDGAANAADAILSFIGKPAPA